MSGRKSSEVVDLLSSGERIRREILSNSYKNINNILKKNNEVILKIERGLQILKEAYPDLPKDEKGTYEKDIKIIENNLKEIKKWQESVKILQNIVIEEEVFRIDKEFSQMDEEAKNLRKSIANKSWYCDREYEEARELVREYEKLKKRVYELNGETEKIYNKNSETLEKSTININNKDELKQQIKYLKNRIEADNHKEQIEKELKSIDSVLANKFLFEDYKKLKTRTEKFISENIIEGINKGSGEIYKGISEFKNLLIYEKEKFDLKKERAQREFKNLKEYVDILSYRDIESLLKSEEGEIVDIFTFQERYCKKNIKNEYLREIAEIKNLIEREKFEESFEKIEKIRGVVEESSINTSKTYERLLKEQSMVEKIVGATFELGYDVDVKGDSVEGYRVEATLGDEVINFDKISIDEEGKPVIDLDHEEGVSGTCGNTMEKLMRALQNEGIFITDITKNGRSVIYMDKEKKQWTTSKNQESSR